METIDKLLRYKRFYTITNNYLKMIRVNNEGKYYLNTNILSKWQLKDIQKDFKDERYSCIIADLVSYFMSRDDLVESRCLEFNEKSDSINRLYYIRHIYHNQLEYRKDIQYFHHMHELYSSHLLLQRVHFLH